MYVLSTFLNTDLAQAILQPSLFGNTSDNGCGCESSCWKLLKAPLKAVENSVEVDDLFDFQRVDYMDSKSLCSHGPVVLWKCISVTGQRQDWSGGVEPVDPVTQRVQPQSNQCPLRPLQNKGFMQPARAYLLGMSNLPIFHEHNHRRSKEFRMSFFLQQTTLCTAERNLWRPMPKALCERPWKKEEVKEKSVETCQRSAGRAGKPCWTGRCERSDEGNHCPSRFQSTES